MDEMYLYNSIRGESVDSSMPAPFEDVSDTDGDSTLNYYATTREAVSSIGSEFIRLVDEDEFNEWLNSNSSQNSDATKISELANLYSFIRHFDIPKDTAKDILVSYRETYIQLNVTGDYLTDYEIDLLLNGSENDVAAYFASDYAIAKDGNIYSQKWIYNHTANEYAAVGITPQQVNEKIDLYAQIPFSNDARTSFENKLSDFVGEKVSLSDNTKTTTSATTTAPLSE